MSDGAVGVAADLSGVRLVEGGIHTRGMGVKEKRLRGVGS
jgi:hypothetical protein